MIAILKYNAGNTTSVANAVRQLGYDTIVTGDPLLLQSSDKVIIPGVGEAGTAMRYLQERGLDETIKALQQPVLGICLGMQLLCEHSEEGGINALGVFNTKVKKFPPVNRVPHTGWNDMDTVKGTLFRYLPAHNDCYFVHSYFAEISSDTAAVTNYILPFSAALQKDNFFGTQFHPEKSAQAGSQILKNFLEL